VAPAPGDGSGQDWHDEVVQFGRGHAGGGRWLSRLALACLAVAAAVALALHAGGQRHPAAVKPAPPPRPPPVRVINLGHPLLGVTAGWELFARGSDDLVRIQFAGGRITRTYVPPLETGNPDVGFVVGEHEAIIRSSDNAPGYVVPDGGQARLLSGPRAGGGPLIPGPNPEQAAWVTAGNPMWPVLALETLTGRRAGPVIHFPSRQQMAAVAVADGRGYALVMDGSFEAYDAGPAWNRAIPGFVAAVGPVNWLVLACNANDRHCRTEVVDSVTGVRRVLSGPVLPDEYFYTWPPPGVIAPDGKTAAVPEAGRFGRTTVHLINLRTGANRDLGVPLGESGGDGVPLGADSNGESMAWSPDGRLLFVAEAGGRLVVVNAQSGRTESLGVTLPAVSQVVIRAQSAAGS
jgi:hypothetical protein